MAHVRKFFRLSPAQRWLLTKAFVVVGSVRLGLWCLPFRTLRPLLGRVAPSTALPSDGEDRHTSDRVAWAVRAAAHYVPRASCLTQALAAQALLARRGEESELHIGVTRDERRGFTAHAWLETRGRIVIGGESLDRYLPLTLLAQRNWPKHPAAQSALQTEVG